MSSWAPDPNKHLYTWTFTKRGFLIRYFLWLYEADQKAMTFCRFFWGMVCSPLVLPIRLAKVGLHVTGVTIVFSVQRIGMSIRWVNQRPTIVAIKTKAAQLHASYDASRQTHSAKVRRKLDAKLEIAERRKIAIYREEFLRRNQEHEAEEINRLEYGGTYQGPRPVQPSIQTNIADGLGRGVDHVVAWFQAHPKIIAGTSKVITRGVFYPLAFIIPTGSVSLTGYELYEHRHGAIGPFHGAWSDVICGVAIAAKEIGGALWLTLRTAGPVLMYTVLTGIGMSIMIVGALWLMVKLDGPHYYEDPDGDLREAPDSLFFVRARASVDRRMEKSGEFFDRRLAPVFTGSVHGLATVGRKMFHGTAKAAKVAVVPVVVASRQVERGAVQTAHAVKTTGSFFAVAHHAIKYRTCPRIEITED